MFGKPLRLFRLFGFPIKLDPSWFIVAVLITWTLAGAVFPSFYGGLSWPSYVSMGVLGALGLFASVVLHETGHSVVARHYGLPIKGITLFIFGGVAEMEREPDSPKEEFLVAIAGPLVSLLLSLLFFGLAFGGQVAGLSLALTGVLSYLASINLLVVLFNSVPAFPLDGGRVLRSAIWKWQGSLRKATHITSTIGSLFGFFLIALGVLTILFGNFVGGLWWMLLGMFLRSASTSSYKHLIVRQSLEGEPVNRFMVTEPVTVTPTITIEELVENFVYMYYYKMFPVVEHGRLLGCITVERLKDIPRDRWDNTTVGEVFDPCSDKNTIPPDADAMELMTRMQSNGISRVMVVDGERLVGIIAMKDLMRFLSLKMELGEEEPGAAQLSHQTQRQKNRTKHALSEQHG